MSVDPQGLIIYGPPASGKTSIASALKSYTDKFVPFRKIKCGGTTSDEYRQADPAKIAALRNSRSIIYENSRYGNLYVVDKSEVDRIFAQSRIPIIHIGQIEGIRAIKSYHAAWTSVLLWCSDKVSEERLHARGSQDVEERLSIWLETKIDITNRLDADFSFEIDTGRFSISESVAKICSEMRL